jgi:hypothetical protein
MACFCFFESHLHSSRNTRRFRGERASGKGGPYRQFFTDIARELQEVVSPASAPASSAEPASASSAPASSASSASSSSSSSVRVYTLPLLVECPNRQANLGNNRDMFVPRAAATAPAVCFGCKNHLVKSRRIHNLCRFLYTHFSLPSGDSRLSKVFTHTRFPFPS